MTTLLNNLEWLAARLRASGEQDAIFADREKQIAEMDKEIAKQHEEHAAVAQQKRYEIEALAAIRAAIAEGNRDMARLKERLDRRAA